MSPSSTTSTRWCPTPEQLMILEELYKRGVRTPNASQIQKITAHLSYYGKIQGKNVFYWFQNHKARDRQKLRKKLAKQVLLQQQHAMQPHMYPLSQTSSYCSTAVSNELHYLQNPSALYQFSTSFNSPGTFDPQGAGSYAVPGVMMGQNWTVDLPKDCSIATYGHDFTMLKETGHTISPCCMNRPLQTLELFPLKSQSDT